MKHRNTLLLILVIQIISLRFTSGQGNQISLELGYGGTNDFSDQLPPQIPNYKNFKNYIRIGILYSATINGSNINLITGLNFDNNIENKPYSRLSNTSNKTQLSYIRIPFGTELHIGKKSQIVTGLGFFISGLVFYSGIDEYSVFEETLKRIQFGGYGNFGFEYHIHEKYCLGIGLQGNIDFTKLYEEWVTSQWGGRSIVKDGYDIFLKINLKYKL